MKTKKSTDPNKANLQKHHNVISNQFHFQPRSQFWSFAGAFLGIGIIALFQAQFFTKIENVFLIGSFGASSVLIFGAIQSPLAQPRNFFGGQLIAAFLGVTIAKFVPDIIWLTAPLAVAGSILAMQLTKTLHPPGGATALIAIIGTEKIKALGYWYVLFPVLSGTTILFLTALLINRLATDREYPVKSS